MGEWSIILLFVHRGLLSRWKWLRRGFGFFQKHIASSYNSWPGAIGATGSWFGWRAHMGWGRGDYIQCNPEVTKSYWLNVDIPPAGDNCWTCRDDLHQGLVATMYSIPYMVNDIALVSLCRSWCGICSQDEDDAVLTLGLCLHDLSLDVTWCHLINKFLVFCESGCKQGFHYSVIIPRKWWFLMCLQLPCRPKPQSKVLLLKQGFTSSWWDQIENNQLFQNIQSPWPVYNPTSLHIYPLPTDQVAPTSSSACGEVSSAPAAGIQEWMSCCECAVAVKLKPCSMEHACGDPPKNRRMEDRKVYIWMKLDTKLICEILFQLFMMLNCMCFLLP